MKFIETGSRMVVVRRWEHKGAGELGFNGHRVSVSRVERALELECGGY